MFLEIVINRFSVFGFNFDFTRMCFKLFFICVLLFVVLIEMKNIGVFNLGVLNCVMID